jgi:hypothetical protein
VEHLRKQAAEKRLIADLATNKAKRETFAKLADHLNALADEVERNGRRMAALTSLIVPASP